MPCHDDTCCQSLAGVVGRKVWRGSPLVDLWMGLLRQLDIPVRIPAVHKPTFDIGWDGAASQETDAVVREAVAVEL